MFKKYIFGGKILENKIGEIWNNEVILYISDEYYNQRPCRRITLITNNKVYKTLIGPSHDLYNTKIKDMDLSKFDYLGGD